MSDFSVLLKKMLVERNLSQSELARRSKIPQCTLSHIITERIGCGKIVANKIANGLELNQEQYDGFEKLAMLTASPLYSRKFSFKMEPLFAETMKEEILAHPSVKSINDIVSISNVDTTDSKHLVVVLKNSTILDIRINITVR